MNFRTVCLTYNTYYDDTYLYILFTKGYFQYTDTKQKAQVILFFLFLVNITEAETNVSKPDVRQ